MRQRRSKTDPHGFRRRGDCPDCGASPGACAGKHALSGQRCCSRCTADSHQEAEPVATRPDVVAR